VEDGRVGPVEKRHSATNILQHGNPLAPVKVKFGVVQDRVQCAMGHELGHHGQVILLKTGPHEEDDIRVSQRHENLGFPPKLCATRAKCERA